MALGHWEIEADYFANAWQFLKSAQDPEVDLANRLESLESLKECLSATDLLAGRMPLPPLHQFAEGPPPEWIEYKRSVYKNQLEPASDDLLVAVIRVGVSWLLNR
jgi:hypothetical protein